jgi:hypothetical protein
MQRVMSGLHKTCFGNVNCLLKTAANGGLSSSRYLFTISLLRQLILNLLCCLLNVKANLLGKSRILLNHKRNLLFTVLSTDKQPCLELMYTRWEALSLQLLVNIQWTRFCRELVNDKRHQEVRLSFRLFRIYLKVLHMGGLSLFHVKTSNI